MNNSDFNLTFQKYICDHHNLNPSKKARAYFQNAYNEKFIPPIRKLYDDIKRHIETSPVKCLTYDKDLNGYDYKDNFLTENNRTISIRTNKKGDKVAPRLVGQAGYKILNEYFSSILRREIISQFDIKELFINYTDEVIPILLDNLFNSDINIWIFNDNSSFDYKIFPKSDNLNFLLEKNNFTFTRDLASWTESTTLKYKGISIAEIQIHKNRTFKFRFILSKLLLFLNDQITNNETLGISAEKAICDLYDLAYPLHIVKRSSNIFVEKIKSSIEKIFTNEFYPIRFLGSNKGNITKRSKSPHDFELSDGSTLSLKTNTGKMVCPPEVGQPSLDTFLSHFGHLIEPGEDINNSIKECVFKNIGTMINVYIHYLFLSDYILHVTVAESVKAIIIKKTDFNSFFFNNENFSFTRKNPVDWNESNTLKYNDLRMGEFQLHKNRSGLKFRFHFENLIKIISQIEN
jgi:hypothetical protein